MKIESGRFDEGWTFSPIGVSWSQHQYYACLAIDVGEMIVLPPNPAREQAVTFPRYDQNYSEIDWRIMEYAHRSASRFLDRDPKFHVRSGRLARTIMNTFNSGEHDLRQLAALGVNRELELMFMDRLSDVEVTVMEAIPPSQSSHAVH